MTRILNHRHHGQEVQVLRFALALVWLLIGISNNPALSAEEVVDRTNPAPSNPQSARKSRGSELAHVYCQRCHLFPDPSLLDRTTWETEALPFMSTWMGINKMNLGLRPGGKRVEAAGLVPSSPLLPAQDWLEICHYYLEESPTKPLPPAKHPRISPNLTGFEVVLPDYRFQVPLTTLLKIDSPNRQFYLGDAGTKTLSVLTARGEMRFSGPVDSAPVSIDLRPKSPIVTLIGSVTPSDEPEGQVIELELTGAGFQRRQVLAANLPRPTDSVSGDLNNDGRADLVVCGFGNYLGRFSWYENLGDGKYAEHVLFDRPGAIKAVLYDFNGDGLLDIMVLMAQAREGIYLFMNRGRGEFSVSTVAEFHPAFGSSHFELVDFNQDGFMDILATNGDNGDLKVSTLKNYHGIRLYLNDGRNNFHESWFFPLNGAYKAVAADFNKDGRMDIAAISFHPDYEHSPLEGFVYLENLGERGFKASSFRESRDGRWLTMDVGDLDGDGYPDIVLGSFIRGPNKVPEAFSERWEKIGPSFVILENTGGRGR